MQNTRIYIPQEENQGIPCATAQGHPRDEQECPILPVVQNLPRNHRAIQTSFLLRQFSLLRGEVNASSLQFPCTSTFFKRAQDPSYKTLSDLPRFLVPRMMQRSATSHRIMQAFQNEIRQRAFLREIQRHLLLLNRHNAFSKRRLPGFSLYLSISPDHTEIRLVRGDAVVNVGEMSANVGNVVDIVEMEMDDDVSETHTSESVSSNLPT